MSNQKERLKNQLRGSEPNAETSGGNQDGRNRELAKVHYARKLRFKNLLGVGVIAIMLFYIFSGSGGVSLNPLNWVNTTFVVGGPSEDLLNRMGNRMIEMGYTGLSHDDLRQLRSDGVTATYISNVRGLGYDDLSLRDAVRLAKADASSRFIAMMIELGYPLTIDEIVKLREAGVTAHYTSNVHDLGYRDVTVDQLIRMRRIGVTPALIKRLQADRGQEIPLEDIIRYQISNQ